MGKYFMRIERYINLSGHSQCFIIDYCDCKEIQTPFFKASVVAAPRNDGCESHNWER